MKKEQPAINLSSYDRIQKQFSDALITIRTLREQLAARPCYCHETAPVQCGSCKAKESLAAASPVVG